MGREQKEYEKRGVISGPMHYPTHSVSGPISVMKAHALKVCCWGLNADVNKRDNDYNNETALFYMSNGTTMLIKEHRQIGHQNLESFSLYGTDGCYVDRSWRNKRETIPLTTDDMRDPLPDDVIKAFKAFHGDDGFYGGHGGSHAYLVHEFISSIANGRQPAINAWEAARYMAAGVMAHKSALRDGEILAVPDWGDAPRR